MRQTLEKSSKAAQVEQTQMSSASRCSLRFIGVRAFTRVMRTWVKSPLETGGAFDKRLG